MAYDMPHAAVAHAVDLAQGTRRAPKRPAARPGRNGRGSRSCRTNLHRSTPAISKEVTDAQPSLRTARRVSSLLTRRFRGDDSPSGSMVGSAVPGLDVAPICTSRSSRSGTSLRRPPAASPPRRISTSQTSGSRGDSSWCPNPPHFSCSPPDSWGWWSTPRDGDRSAPDASPARVGVPCAASAFRTLAPECSRPPARRPSQRVT